MKKIVVILMFAFLSIGCIPTKERSKTCRNKQNVQGIISDVKIDAGTFEDSVIVEFADGRVMSFVKKHDINAVFCKGKMHTIRYSGDDSLIFYVKVHKDRKSKAEAEVKKEEPKKLK